MFYACLLVSVLYFIRHGNTQEADQCFPPEWLESVSLSVNITKAGFHRDLEYTLQWGETDDDIKALLIQKVPSGVYMDEYQLETLRRDTGLEVLLDSAVDLEAPEYLSSGFTALVFLSDKRATVPIHGRYHRPSATETHVKVELETSRVLLRSERCQSLGAVSPHSAVEAPCSIRNDSACWWLEVRSLQAGGVVGLTLPVGDSSMTVPVCVGTVLTAALGCFYLLTNIWKHGTF